MLQYNAFVCIPISGALIHHSAYRISVYRLVFCYIGIGIGVIIADIKSIDR